MSARTLDRTIAATLCAWAVALVAWLVLTGAGVTREDGYYYLQIARNVAWGRGSTFDGVTPTNGYHPLWMLVLVPVFRAFPSTDDGHVAAVALQAATLATALAVLYRLLRRNAGALASALAATLWVALVYREAVSGLEFAVHALAVTVAASVYARRRDAPPSAGADLGLGALLALAFLARLENVVLAAFVIAAVAIEEVRRGRPPVVRLLRVSLPVAAAVGAYAAVNLWLFGAWTPVSGALKREWAQHTLARDPRYVSGGWARAKLHQLRWPVTAMMRAQPPALAVALALGAYLAPALLVARRLLGPAPGLARARGGLAEIAPFVAFGVVQMLAAIAVYHGEGSFAGSSWYYAVQPLAAAVAVAALGQSALERVRGRGEGRPRWVEAILVGALAALALRATAAAATARAREMPDLRLDAAAWARDNLARDAVLGSWNAGVLGYRSERRVVNLDGLVNSWSFYRGERRDLCAYWERVGVTHLVDLFDEGKRPAAPEPAAGAFAACVDRLEPIHEVLQYRRRWRLAVYRLRPRE